MSSARAPRATKPIELDLSAAFDYQRGVGRAELLAIAMQLDDARKSMLSAAIDGKDMAILWPQPCLQDYKRQRKSSQLGRILHLARQLRDAVDRVVVLGPPAIVSAARALFAASCHPHHNELSRGQRGGRPRIYFLAAEPDNDAVAALLEILPRSRSLHSAEDRWGIIALDVRSNEVIQSSDLIRGLFLYLWEALQSTTTADEETQLAAVVGPAQSPLIEFADKIGIEAVIHPFAFCTLNSAFLFEPAVLLAGSVIGIDIVNLLRGAAAMTERFATQPVGANPIVDLAGLQFLLAQHGIRGWRIASSASALEPLAQCLHPASGGDHLLVQWIVENHRHDRLQISMQSGKTLEGRPKKMERPLAGLVHGQLAEVRNARAATGQPTAVTRLPTIDEASIGQLIQMFSLASAVRQMLDGKAIPTPDS